MQRDGNKKLDPTGSGSSSTQKNPVFTTLVVEDQAAYEGLLSEFFKAEGHFVLRATTATEALAMTRQHWPDLILLNREMEGTAILEFLPELLMEHPSAAVIVMADKSSVAEAVEAMKQGAVDYLERPLDAEKLKKAIDIQKALFKIL